MKTFWLTERYEHRPRGLFALQKKYREESDSLVYYAGIYRWVQVWS